MFSHPENVTDVSNSLKLIIPVPPSWKDKPSNQEVTLGQRVEVPCGADGAPKPKIIWKKEQKYGTSIELYMIYYTS